MRLPSTLRALGLALLVSGAGSFLAPQRASACSCALPTHADAVQRYAVAFRGRVISKREARGFITYRFRVLTPYKGARSRTVVVHGVAGLRMCPVPTFRVGQSYNVYVNTAEGSSRLELEACNPSGHISPPPAATPRP